MGATYWERATTYGEAAEEALRRAQIQFFQESGYDTAKLLAERIEDMVEAVRLCEEEEDSYNLLELYRDALDQYRLMAAQGVPEDLEAQIELLRRIEATSGDWVGNILDMTGLSSDTEEGRVQQLTPERIEEVFGTACPSLPEARRGMRRFRDSIPRGTAICFPVSEDGRPVAWFFAGYSAD